MRNDLQAASRVQVAATQEEDSKESLDWDARAAEVVAAARARGADLGALVDRKEQRAGYLRRKAEQKEAEAAASSAPRAQGLVEAAALAQAEVPAQLLCPVSDVAPDFDW